MVHGCGSNIQNPERINNTTKAAEAASWNNNFIRRWNPQPGMDIDQFYNLWIYSVPYRFIDRTSKGYHFQIFIRKDFEDWESISIKENNQLIEYRKSGYWVLSLDRISSKIYYFNSKTRLLEFIDKGDYLQTLIDRTSKKLKKNQADLIINNQPDLDNNTIYDYADY